MIDPELLEGASKKELRAFIVRLTGLIDGMAAEIGETRDEFMAARRSRKWLNRQLAFIEFDLLMLSEGYSKPEPQPMPESCCGGLCNG